MRSSAVLYTLCVGNLLFIPVSTAEAAIYEFMASPVKRVMYATTTYVSSSLIYSVKRFCSHNAIHSCMGSQLMMLYLNTY